MLNVSKRSLVDTEFSVSTFGMENSNFLPSSKVAHSSLCTAFGVSAWGSLHRKTGAGQRGLFTSSLLSLPSCHRDGWRIWCHKPSGTLQLSPARLEVTGRKVTLAQPLCCAPSWAVCDGLVGMSNPQPKMAMSVAQHNIVSLLKTF